MWYFSYPSYFASKQRHYINVLKNKLKLATRKMRRMKGKISNLQAVINDLRKQVKGN